MEAEHSGEAEGEEAGEAIVGTHGDPKAAKDKEEEEAKEDQDAEETEFFAYDGKDEVGVGFGEVSEFELALSESDAPEAAGCKGTEGLDELKTAVFDIFGRRRVCEGGEAFEAVGTAGKDEEEGRKKGQAAQEEVAKGDTRKEHQESGEEEKQHRGAEVGFKHQEEDHEKEHDDGGEKADFELSDAFGFTREGKSEVKNQGDLGELTGLADPDACDLQPAGGTASFDAEARDEDQEEEEEGDPKGGPDKTLEAVRRHEKADKEGEQGEGEADPVLPEEERGIAVLFLCEEVGGREDHHHAEEGQGKADGEKPRVAFEEGRTGRGKHRKRPKIGKREGKRCPLADS